tara:strand:- start:510 stop:995 length:486 start_codon:yes stop_codon:yes gene_type:complete
MKKFLTLLLTIITFISYSQTNIELLVFDALNEYRVKNNFSALEFNDTVLLAAEHHNTYLKENGYPFIVPLSNPHREKILVRPLDRLFKYGIITIKSGECIVYVPRGMGATDEDLVNNMISWWDSSPTHKRVILDSDFTIGAISVVEVQGICLVATLNVIKR